MLTLVPPEFKRKPRPTHEQPGTLLEQMQAIVTSIYLGDRRDTSAHDEWQEARARVIPHAREAGTPKESRSCSPHNDPDNHITTPDPRRNGWLETRCRKCGRLIGYRRAGSDRKDGAA